MQEKLAKRKLNKTQLAHALNRLQAIYHTKTSPISSTSAAQSIDWANDKEVALLVKTYNLPTPTWKEFGYYYTNGAMPAPFYNKADAAIRARNKARVGNVAEKMANATAFFCAAQDALIFNDPPASAEVAKFLTKFEADLSAIVK